MDRQRWWWWWWVLAIVLSNRVGAFECPEGAGCSGCQRYPEDIYEMDCSTGSEGVIKVEIRAGDYAKLICHNEANWTEFHLGASHPMRGIKSLSFSMCNLPEDGMLGNISRQLFVDEIDALYFSSYMNLSSSLTGETLSDLGSVKKLTLSSNNFTILPEDLLKDVKNLTFLNLRDNNLHGVPKNFFDSTRNLKIIEISTNELEALDSSTFGRLDNLRLLNIWDNKLVEISPDAFYQLASLETLGLQRNRLESLPKESFQRLLKLRILNLSQNNFSLGSLPANLLKNCEELSNFMLMENKRNLTTLPDGFFANLRKLETVKLRRIGLSSLPEDLFRGAVNLHNVSIERNYLSTLPRRIFNDTPDLYSLDLNFNDLASLPDDVFANLRNLVKLDLSRNHLTDISEKLFSDLASLRELNMEQNDIVSIHFHALDSLQNLRVAKFSHNLLTLKSSWGTLGSPFRASEELEELYLDHNNISDIFEDWMYSMRAIRVLDLSYNKLQLLKDQDLQFLSQNLHVDLTHNMIRQINLDTAEIWAIDRSYSRNVIVSIENNPIECDCKLYNLLRYLEGRLHPNVQNAFHLKIGQLRCDTPVELRNIAITDLRSKTLKCDANEQEFESDCPSPCTCQVRPENKAYLINCSNSSLTKAPIAIESPLGYSIELDLSNNLLTSMPSFDQPGYESITILALDRNNITSITTDALSPNLKILKLNSNHLSRVDRQVIDYLANSTELTELRLDSNPWYCDCDARGFLTFVQKKSVTVPDLRKITCPGNETPLFQMTPEELCPSSVAWIIGGCLAVAFFGVVIGALAALYYRYQREIKVWLFAKSCCLWFVTEDELDRDKLFDAFISYSHRDEDFVVNELMPKLEAEPRPFKLCVHFRDWLAGEWIPKQIARSVEDSRRTIVVLSPNFLESVWGRMEFRAAHSQALSEGRARVIVILYGEIGPTDELDPELKAYLSMNTYVKWGDPWFWEKLKYAMPHPPEFVKRKPRTKKNIFETAQPRIGIANDKSELIASQGLTPLAPSPIVPAPPTDPVKIFIVNGDVSSERCEKSFNNETGGIDQSIANLNAINSKIGKIHCTTV